MYSRLCNFEERSWQIVECGTSNTAILHHYALDSYNRGSINAYVNTSYIPTCSWFRYIWQNQQILVIIHSPFSASQRFEMQSLQLSLARTPPCRWLWHWHRWHSSLIAKHSSGQIKVVLQTFRMRITVSWYFIVTSLH